MSRVRDALIIFSLAKQKGRLVAARVRQGRSVCREDVSVCFRRYLILLGDASKGSGGCFSCVLQTWQRPTLPRLKTKYHRRWGVSRPCSEWERVQPPRQNHQVGKAQDLRLAWRKPNEKLVEVFTSVVLNTSLISRRMQKHSSERDEHKQWERSSQSND